jgi:PhnB protein
MNIHVYLNFKGNCEEAFHFYRTVFGGEFSHVGKFHEMPADEFQISDEDRNRIMHISLPYGNSMIMGSDIPANMDGQFKQGNNFSVSISTDTKEEADRVFTALSEGGQVVMPMDNTFWGDYFGMITDKFGIGWMISYNEAFTSKAH